MFRSITFNGTDKKQIGAPIIRRTNEMINEFDLQYERNYKIEKVVSQRELDFQEYLKQQEAKRFRLENLIKILRQYFKENNYNSNTYYILFKNKYKKNRRGRRKKRKKMRPKTTQIKRNKNLFYKITKNLFYFTKFKPYLYPLTNKEKKEFERKIYTDVNLKEKEISNLYNMSPSQLKKFVDVFGFLPVTFKKEEEDKEIKKIKKNRNFSRYLFMNKKKSNSFGNKNQINFKKGKNNMKNSHSYTNLLNNLKLKFNNLLNKNSKNNLGLYNKLYKSNFKYNNDNKINNNIFNKILYKTFRINRQKTNNYNNIFNNRYYNLKQLNPIWDMKLRSNKVNNNLDNHSLQSSKNLMFYANNKYHNNFISNKNNENKNTKIKIKIKKNLKLENLQKKSFTNQCIRTIQKAEILNKDINFLNKEYKISGHNFNIKRNKIENKTLQKANYMSFMQIFEKDFRPDIKKQFEKKYEHLKEDNQGKIQVKKIDFLRKPKSKLNFVRIYNKRREQKQLYKVECAYYNNDEEKSDLTSFRNKRSVSNIKLSRNIFNKYKYIVPVSSMK